MFTLSFACSLLPSAPQHPVRVFSFLKRHTSGDGLRYVGVICPRSVYPHVESGPTSTSKYVLHFTTIKSDPSLQITGQGPFFGRALCSAELLLSTSDRVIFRGGARPSPLVILSHFPQSRYGFPGGSRQTLSRSSESLFFQLTLPLLVPVTASLFFVTALKASVPPFFLSPTRKIQGCTLTPFHTPCRPGSYWGPRRPHCAGLRSAMVATSTPPCSAPPKTLSRHTTLLTGLRSCAAFCPPLPIGPNLAPPSLPSFLKKASPFFSGSWSHLII